MKDLISIVLPVYNGEQFLAKSIESVISQTYKNWELLILDDCSKDSTAEIAQKYCECDSRIKYHLNAKNLRLPGNLNRGFSLAKGNYLTWTSDDNMFRADALERMINALQTNEGVDFVYASYQVIDVNENPIQTIFADRRGLDHILGSNVVGACFMYTRHAYEVVGEYDVDLMLVEDFDYWQRMFAHVKSVYIDDVLYDYRWHDNSLTSTKKEKQFGLVTEKMLLKNKPLYPKLNIEQKAYYYRCLHTSYRMQGKKFGYSLQEEWYNLLSRLINRVKKSN